MRYCTAAKSAAKHSSGRCAKIVPGTPCAREMLGSPHHPGHQNNAVVGCSWGLGDMRVLLPIVLALSVVACSSEPQNGVHAAFKACSKGVSANLDNDQRALLMERCMRSRGYTIAIRAQ
jgi:hypothetical protein